MCLPVFTKYQPICIELQSNQSMCIVQQSNQSISIKWVVLDLLVLCKYLGVYSIYILSGCVIKETYIPTNVFGLLGCNYGFCRSFNGMLSGCYT